MRVKSLGEQLLISDWIINRSILPTDVSAAAKKRLVESWLDPGLLNSLRPYCEYLFMNRYIRWISSPPFRRENEKQNGCVFETRWNFQRRKNIFKRGSSSSVVWKLSFFFFSFLLLQKLAPNKLHVRDLFQWVSILPTLSTHSIVVPLSPRVTLWWKAPQGKRETFEKWTPRVKTPGKDTT